MRGERDNGRGAYIAQYEIWLYSWCARIEPGRHDKVQWCILQMIDLGKLGLLKQISHFPILLSNKLFLVYNNFILAMMELGSPCTDLMKFKAELQFKAWGSDRSAA